MPNWCENELSVSGDKAVLDRFVKKAKAKGTELSLAKIFPEPDYKQVKVKPTFPGIRKKEGEYVDSAEAWWDWRIQNWGTKWDVEAMADRIDDEEVVYLFDSAWSPPVGWIEYASKKYPELRFKLKYDEPGMAFMGVASAFAGETDDKTVEY